MDFHRCRTFTLSLSLSLAVSPFRLNLKCAQENRLSLQEFITLTVSVFSLLRSFAPLLIRKEFEYLVRMQDQIDIVACAIESDSTEMLSLIYLAHYKFLSVFL